MACLIASVAEIVATFIVEYAAKWLMEVIVGAIVAYITEVAIEYITAWLMEAMSEAFTQLTIFIRNSFAFAQP